MNYFSMEYLIECEQRVKFIDELMATRTTDEFGAALEENNVLHRPFIWDNLTKERDAKTVEIIFLRKWLFDF